MKVIRAMYLGGDLSIFKSPIAVLYRTMELKISRVLVYYDVPRLFIATDEILTKFLCMAISEEEYILLPSSSEKIYKVTSGKMDLRIAFSESETGTWYRWNLIDHDTLSFDVSTPIREIQESCLPEDGFLMADKAEEDRELLLNQTEKQTTVMEISISDEQDNTSIWVSELGAFLENIQSVVSNLYRKVTAGYNDLEKAMIDDRKYHTLRAFAVSPWSFKVHIEIDSQRTVWPSPTEFALIKLDSILQDGLTDELLICEFRKNTWHALNSIKRLLDSLKDNNMQFKYQWIGGGTMTVSKRRLTKERIAYLSHLLSTKDDLTRVVREISWVVQAADVKWEWRILNDEDEREYKWTYTGWFSGEIEVKGAKYKFICEEIIEAYKVSEKEKVKYVLMSYQRLVDSPAEFIDQIENPELP